MSSDKPLWVQKILTKSRDSNTWVIYYIGDSSRNIRIDTYSYYTYWTTRLQLGDPVQPELYSAGRGLIHPGRILTPPFMLDRSFSHHRRLWNAQR